MYLGVRNVLPNQWESFVSIYSQVLEDGKPLFKSADETSRVTAVALSVDGETVAYGCENGSVKLFRTLKVIRTMERLIFDAQISSRDRL